MKASHVSRFLGGICVAFLAACTDGSPAGPEVPEPQGPVALAELACRADVARRTVSCDSAALSPAAGARTDLVVGGQRTYVFLQSSGITVTDLPDAVQADTFSFDVSIQNLIPQALGTTDGTTLAPEAVRVFFHRLPTVTAGVGQMEVANPDGYGAFTAADQPYFRFDAVLDSGEVSPKKRWKLSYTQGVQSFDFLLLVAAPVQYPNGWVQILGSAASMTSGTQRTLTAVARDYVGRTVQGGELTWSTSDSTVVSLTRSAESAIAGAYRTGSAQLTASMPGRPGRPAPVTVTTGPVAAIVNAGRTGLNAAPGQALPDSVVVRVVDAQGNPVSNVSVRWQASGGGSVAQSAGFTRVDGTVRTVWTVGSTGAQELTAVLGNFGAIAPATMQAVLVEQGTQRTWTGASAADPTAWAEPQNWSPVGVPTARDTAIIPAAATGEGHTPTMSASAVVGRLLSDGTIRMRGAVLRVQGGVHFDGEAVGPGRLHLRAASRLAGRLPTLVVTTGADSLHLTGALRLDSLQHESGVLSLQGKRLDVGGEFLASGGTLLMRHPGDTLVIGGLATFGGVSRLSAGVTRVGGNWGVGGGGRYEAIGTHLTVFEGIAAQRVYVPANGSSFGSVVVRNQVDANLSGAVTIQSGLTLEAGARLSVALPGMLSGTVQTSTLTLLPGSRLTNNGSVQVGSRCVNDSGNPIGPNAPTGAPCAPSAP